MGPESGLCGPLGLLIFLLQFVVITVASSGQMQKFEVYMQFETRRSNLSCFYCFNGDQTDCMGMSDIHKIRTTKCFINEPYCKVRRLTTAGQLTTFDRYCAEECTPGCQEGGLYSECVSCCNDRNFCNVDNSAHPVHVHHVRAFPARFVTFLLTVAIRLA